MFQQVVLFHGIRKLIKAIRCRASIVFGAGGAVEHDLVTAKTAPLAGSCLLSSAKAQDHRPDCSLGLLTNN